IIKVEPVTYVFPARNKIASAIDSGVPIFPTGNLRPASRTCGSVILAKSGEFPKLPGDTELTRIGARSKARPLTNPSSAALMALRIADDLVGRLERIPDKIVNDPPGIIWANLAIRYAPQNFVSMAE